MTSQESSVKRVSGPSPPELSTAATSTATADGSSASTTNTNNDHSKKIRSRHHQSIHSASVIRTSTTLPIDRDIDNSKQQQPQQEEQPTPSRIRRRTSFPLAANSISMEYAAAVLSQEQATITIARLPVKLRLMTMPNFAAATTAASSSSSDVDTRDVHRVTGPLHPKQQSQQLPYSHSVVGPSRVRLAPTATLLRPQIPLQVQVQFQSPPSIRPRLTLSAFRRPEHTVRLTQSDPSRLLETDYDLRSPGCGILGHGAFSTVRLARRNSDNLQVAIKSIAKRDALRARRLRLGRGGGRSSSSSVSSSACSSGRHMDEWEILQTMDAHSHIITLLDIFETDETIHLVTEFCEGGELFDAIQKKRNRSPAVRRGHYSEAQAACITRQLLTALRDLHGAGIIHRDLKPENIVLVNEDDANIHAKLCDFGMARMYDRDGGSTSDTETPPSTPGRKHSFCAVSCDYYAAPEVCAIGSAHRPSADVYSLGVTLYILLCGFPPVLSDGLSGDEEYTVLFPEVQWTTVSEKAKGLIRKMLISDPAKRITAETALQDEWILQFVVLQLQHQVADKLTPVGLGAKAVAPLQPVGTTAIAATKIDDANDPIRSRLYQALSRLQEEPPSAKKRRGSDVIVTPRRKRRRGSIDLPRSSIARRRGSIDLPRSSIAMKELYCDIASVSVVAMKDLYSDMASVSAVATAAAAGVVCHDDKSNVRVFNADIEKTDSSSASSFKTSPHMTLSA